MIIALERQVEIMESQLSAFDSLLQKMQYMSMFFDSDPSFTQEAKNIVRGNLCRTLPLSRQSESCTLSTDEVDEKNTMNRFKVPLLIIRTALLMLFTFLLGVAGGSNIIVAYCGVSLTMLLVATYVSYITHKMSTHNMSPLIEE
jgi:hypothetical protein